MARKRNPDNQLDPATGRPLPAGVTYRGPAQYRVRKMVNGKRLTETFETAKLAAARLQAVEVDLRRDEFVDRSMLDRITLRETVQRFIDDKMQPDGPRRGAAEDMGHVVPILNDSISALKMSKVTSVRVKEFRDRQAEQFAPGTVLKRLNLLAAILEQAITEWGYPLGANPACAASVARPKDTDVKRTRTLMAPEPDDVRKALADGQPPPKHDEERVLDAMATSKNPWDIWLAKWAIATAFRQSETFALEWRDINFDLKTVQVHGRERRGTKNKAKPDRGKRRQKKVLESHGVEIRPLMPDAIEILNQLPRPENTKPTDKVFPAGNQKAFAVRFGRMLERADIIDLTYHDLRHEATSRLAKIFTNPLDLKRVTGHRDIKSLDRYYQPNMSDLAKAAEKAAQAKKTSEP